MPSASITYSSGFPSRSEANAILPVGGAGVGGAGVGGAGVGRHPEADTAGNKASIATAHTITVFFISETPAGICFS